MNVDPLARIYRSLEYLAFGQTLERCRYSLLDAAATAQSVLIVGEGDGRFLAHLLSRNSTMKVDVIEVSARMLALARARLSPPDLLRVRFLRQDARQPLPDATYEAIVTNFFLDCLTPGEAHNFIQLASQPLKPGGHWLIADFHQPTGGLAALHAWLWLSTMYRFFALTTGLRASRLPDYPHALAQAGLVKVQQRYWRWGLLTAEVWRKT